METLFTGQNLIKLNSVDSTNNYAAKLVNTTNVPEGTVIVAHEQTEGKGNRGTSWSSEAGKNLICSVIYRPGFLKTDHQFYLSMSVALAVMETLQHFLPEVLIKWPNDIYCERKKIAGILIENTIQDQQLSTSVIGIGINVNQVEFSSELRATSLKLILQQEQELDLVLQRLCSYLEKWYLILKTGDHKRIKSSFCESMLNFNKLALYEKEDNEFLATITDVQENGFLVLKDEQGISRSFELKSIKQLI